MKENERREKMCLFFASDYHFEMISLPYISSNLDKEKKIIIITENNLENTVEKVLERTNLANEKKDKIIKIDWKNDDLNKFKEIKIAKDNKKDTIIFVKGKENYIDNMNKNIENWINIDDVEIINCYDINEIKNEVGTIARNYNKILSTSGVEKLLN